MTLSTVVVSGGILLGLATVEKILETMDKKNIAIFFRTFITIGLLIFGLKILNNFFNELEVFLRRF